MTAAWRSSRSAICAAIAIVALAMMCASASAAAIYWDGGSASWNIVSNWSTASGATTPDPLAIPGLGDDVTFNITGVNGAETITLDGDQWANSLTFKNTGTTALTGGDASHLLTLGAGGINVTTGAGAVTIGSTTAGQEVNLALNASQTWNVVTSLTVNNIISGSGFGITKTGAGTLTLNGANTYSGGTTITGLLLAGNSNALGSGAVTVNGATGNQLQLGNGVNVGNSLVINGGGAVGQGVLYVPTGNATYSGTINITANANSGGHFATSANSTLLTIAGDNTITSTVSLTVRNGYVLFSGAQSYSTGTTLGNAGATIQFAKKTSMPSAGIVSIVSGSTLAVNAGGAGEFTAGTGAGTILGLLNNTGGQGAPVTLNSGSSIGIDTTNATGGTFVLAEAFTPGTNIGLVKVGTGTLQLNNGGTYSGNGAAGFPFVVRRGTVLMNGGTNTVNGEAVVGGLYTTANGAAGYDSRLQIDAGTLAISGYLSIGRGNGIGAVSSDLVLNNNAVVTAANLSAGYNGGNAANRPKGSITLNGSSRLTDNGAFVIGESDGSDMTVTVNDSATLEAKSSGNVKIGNTSGKGTLIMNGGTFNAASLAIGYGTSNAQAANGTVTLNSGAVLNSEGDVLMGYAGSASSQSTLNIEGGTLNVASTTKRWMIVGQWDFTNSTINVDSGNLNLNAGTDIRFKTGNNGSGTNVFNLNGGNVTSFSDNAITANGAGVVDLMNSGTADTNNTFNLNGGTLSISQVISATNNGKRTFNFNGGVLKSTLSNTSFFNLGTGNAFANVRGGGAIVDTNGKTITIPQPLLHSSIVGDNAVDGGLQKQGLGILTLTGINTYTGPTAVNAGTLVVDTSSGIESSSGVTVGTSSPASSGILVNNATITPAVTLTSGTLDGIGIFNSATVADNASNIVTNGNGGSSVLSFNSLTFGGAARTSLNIASSSPAISVTGSLTTGLTAGSITIDVTNKSSGGWAPGVYDLISYGSLNGGGFSAFTKGTIAGLGARQIATLGNSAPYITLTIAGDVPVWTGLSNGNWTTSAIPSPKNWKLATGGTATDFLAGDVVTFDDTAGYSGGTTDVVISSANVAPLSVTFKNSLYAYTVSSAPATTYGIADNGSTPTTVSLLGTGTVTLASANTYSGGTTVAAGTLNINNSSAIGTGVLTLDNSATYSQIFLDASSGPIALTTNNPQAWNCDFSFIGTNNLNLGAGEVSINANRTLTVSANTLTVGALKSNGNTFTKMGFGTLAWGGTSDALSNLTISEGAISQSANTTTVAGPMSVSGNYTPAYNLSGGKLVKQATAGQMFWVGNGGSMSGSMTISGMGSNAGWLDIQSDEAAIGDNSGIGTLTMTGDAKITLSGGGNHNFYLGRQGGTGFMTMSDQASYVCTRGLTGAFVVGGGWGGGGGPGNGDLTLSNTASINTSNEFWIGEMYGATGTVTLNDSASITTGSWFVVGRENGNGTLTMNGGTVTKGTNGNFVVGSLGATGTVNMNGGTIVNNANLVLGENSGAIANFYLNYGTVQANLVTAWGTPTTSAMYYNGGTLQATAASASFVSAGVTQYVQIGGAQIDSNGFAITIATPFVEDVYSMGGGFTKLGTGSVTLTAVNTYMGPTAVNAGSLILNAAGDINASSGITINGVGAKFVQSSTTALTVPVTVTTGTLDGTGFVTSATVDNATGGIIANGNGTASPLTIDTLTFTGAASTNLTTTSGTPTVPVLVTTSLATGGGPITVNASSDYWVNGKVYDLISYSSLSGSFANFLKGTVTGLTSRQSASLVNVPGSTNYIALSIAGDIPVWTGAYSGHWTTTTIPSPKNWKMQTGGAATDFITGDTVLFDDSATGTTTVEISDANVSPTDASFNNSTKSYVLNSAGGYGILTGFLMKSGSGSLTINTANSYPGGTILTAGMLNIGTAAALGSGALTINGGTLDNTSAGAITLAANNAVNLNGDVTFTGSKSLSFGTGNVLLGGSGSSRTITVASNTLAVNSIPSATGYGFTKAGPGTLELLSTANNATTIAGTLNVAAGTVVVHADVTVGGLTGAGTITNGNISTLDKWFFVNNAADCTFDGTILGGASRLGLNKSGAGTLTLTNSGNVIDDAITVNQGTLNFTGSHTLGQYYRDSVGNTADANAALNISAGGSFHANYYGGQWTSSIAVGTVAASAGSISLNGGTLTAASQFGLGAGAGAYAAYTQNSGTASTGSYLVVGLGDDRSVANFNGGTMTVGANMITVAAGNSGSIGLMNVYGGTVNSTADNGSASTIGGIFVGETGVGTLNVAGGNLNLSGWGLRIGHVAGSTGVVNLLGGTVTTTGASQGAGVATLNFNGGTLNASGDNATFLQDLTQACIYSGGAKLDDGGHAITIAQPLTAPTGGGVTAEGLTFSGGGYINTPFVDVLGDGTGATATANIDSLGNLIGITITNPGVNYSYAYFTLSGGGAGNTGEILGYPTIVDNVGGGLTKTGLGTLTLTGALSYTGDTVVNEGSLVIGGTGVLDTPTAGVFVASNATLSASSITADSLTIGGGPYAMAGATISTAPVPEPSSIALLTLALLGLIGGAFRRAHANSVRSRG